MSEPTFQQEPLTLMEMNLIIRALEWAVKDKNNPDRIRDTMGDLRAKMQNRLDIICETID
jgi:hypothetical protein